MRDALEFGPGPDRVLPQLILARGLVRRNDEPGRSQRTASRGRGRVGGIAGASERRRLRRDAKGGGFSGQTDMHRQRLARELHPGKGRHSRHRKGLERQSQARERLYSCALESDGTDTSDGESGQASTETAIDSLGVVRLLFRCVGVLLWGRHRVG